MIDPAGLRARPGKAAPFHDFVLARGLLSQERVRLLPTGSVEEFYHVGFDRLSGSGALAD